MRYFIKVLALLLLCSSSASASLGAVGDAVIKYASARYLAGTLDLTPQQKAEMDCLTKVIWYEARGESKLGKILVANVVQNRADYGKPFANTICKVVYQKGQFEWTKNTSKKNSKFIKIAPKYLKNERKQVMDTVEIALNYVLFKPEPIFKATHFCSIGTRCGFKNVEMLRKVGNHTTFAYLGNP